MNSTEPIAIVGLGMRFPGNAVDAESYWQLLVSGQDAITEIPTDRWNARKHYHPDRAVPGKSYSRWGGFINGIDEFEPECFGISPREAAYIDPQQRLLLEVAWEAVEDAGVPGDALSGTKTGVFIGISTSDYADIQTDPYKLEGFDPHTATGAANSIAANRISYCLNLFGPSLAVDTACSSSLVAVHLARRSLLNGECELALVGSVNVLLTPGPFACFSAASMLSPTGRCKAFDASADGFVRAEGASAVLLKPLGKALEDNDPVHALLVGSAVNQDGRTSGISFPSQSSQEALLNAVLRDAGMSPLDVCYVEAHGTGTAVGDPVEATALGNVFGTRRAKDHPCVVGSVKSNIGHLEAGAGMAGLIKTCLMLRHRKIPPNLHFNQPNPNIDFDRLQIRVPTSEESLPEPGPVVVGVNSFGFGGTNAHVLVREHRSSPLRMSRGRQRDAEPETRDAGTTTPDHGAPPQSPVLLPVSARSRPALEELAASYRRRLETEAPLGHDRLRDFAYTASLRRTHYPHRLALVVGNGDELMERLDAFLAGQTRPGLHASESSRTRTPKMTFVFSGQGPQWWGMGRQLLECNPLFRSVIEKCDAWVRAYGGWSLCEELSRDQQTSRLHETAIAQPSICALQIGLAEVWKSWGIMPDAVVGHSVGEIAAAHVARALDGEQAMRVIVQRGSCMDRPSSRGGMVALGCSLDEAREAIREHSSEVTVGAHNSPSSVTLSGDPVALEALQKVFDGKGYFTKRLPVDYAFHSARMDPAKKELAEALRGLEPDQPHIPFVSTVTGQPADGARLDGEYWWRNIRQPVRFHDAVTWLAVNGHDTFLELGPHPILGRAVVETLAAYGTQAFVLPTLRREENDQAVMLSSLGALYARGHTMDWRAQWPEDRPFVSLPRHPWRRERYWHEAVDLAELRIGKKEHPLVERAIDAPDQAWDITLDKRFAPYFDDHRLQQHAIVPVAAYVELALAIARDHLNAEGCLLQNVQFQRALFLADEGAAPSVRLSLQSGEGFWQIASKTSSSDDNWTRHCIGYLRPGPVRSGDSAGDLDVLRKRVSELASVDLCYARFRQVGLDYGPAFRGIRRLWRRHAEALGRVELPKALREGDTDYCFHPALLDACFQVLSEALPKARSGHALRLYLPSHIRRVGFHRSPGHRVWVHARLTDMNATAITAELHVYGEHGDLLVEINDFKCLVTETLRSSNLNDNWLYADRWSVKPLSELPVVPSPASYLPAVDELIGTAQQEADRVLAEVGGLGKLTKGQADLDALALRYFVLALRDLGWNPPSDTPVEPNRIIRDLPVAAQHRKFVRRFLSIFEKMGDTAAIVPKPRAGNSASVTDDVAALWQHCVLHHPGLLAELTLVSRCGRRLADVLRGHVEPTSLIFPDGETTTAEHLYQDSGSFRIYNAMAAGAVRRAVRNLPANRLLRVLEVGAGTGGLTAHVVPVLPAAQTQYVFSDVAPLLVSKAEARFRGRSSMEFKTFDLEKDFIEQGFDPHSFDLILASNVVHICRDLRAAVRTIGSLLSARGLLVLMEAERAPPWAELVFGLTEGWWRFEDLDLRPNSPVIPGVQWKRVLKECGFADVAHRSVTRTDRVSSQVVVLAQGPAIVPTERPTRVACPSAGASETPAGAWLVFTDRDQIGSALADRLRARGDTCIMVQPGHAFQRVDAEHFEVAPGEPDHIARLLDEVTTLPGHVFLGIAHLWALDTPSADTTTPASLRETERLGCHTVLHLVQVLARREATDPRPRLVVVTRGAQPPTLSTPESSPAQASLVGLGRVIANEHPDVVCKLVDLGGKTTRTQLDALSAELLTTDPDEEVVLQGDTRFVPRLQAVTPEKTPLRGRSGRRRKLPFRAEVIPGAIENLVIKETRPPKPALGQLAIEVLAAGLNFRDVLKALGLDPTEAEDRNYPGGECAGRVVGVGRNVSRFKPGDEVMALAPASFGSYALTSSDLAVIKPRALTFEEAATVPITFLSSYYALVRLAQLAAGETVLVHSGTGGVGLSAIQIARHLGAQVLATAGSPEKRSFLGSLGVEHVMDSRSLDFGDEVRALTGGRGVDVILNALAGPSIRTGVSCLAPYGRFVELGKRDIYQDHKLGLWEFRRNLSYFAFDLVGLTLQKPEIVQSLLHDLSQLVRKRVLFPLPYRAYPISRATEAFRHLSQAKHIGKVVVSVNDPSVAVEPLRRRRTLFHKDATYLITGGFGGFGLALAKWIVANGGRNLALIGRRGGASVEAQRALRGLRRKGARVAALKADVSIEQDMDRAFARMEKALPPIKGVFHAAMVLDDGVLTQLDADRFEQVLAPKVQGAWNLHTRTRHSELDHFVLFSSASSTIGNPGQGNYVAANAFLDAMAHHRRALGLPAIAINWGQLAEVGVVARNSGVAKLLSHRGILSFTPQQALAALERILRDQPVQVAVMRMDWQRFGAAVHSAKRPERLSYVAGDRSPEAGSQESGGQLREALQHAPPEERAELVQAYMTQQVARVLGASAHQLDNDRPMGELGLDSLMAVELKTKIETDLDLVLPESTLAQNPTITGLSEALLKRIGVFRDQEPRRESDTRTEPASSTEGLVPLRASGERRPLFCIHPSGGDVNIFRDLVSALPANQPVWGIQSRLLTDATEEHSTIEDMAIDYARQIQSQQRHGPYALFGLSLGGLVAITAARLLQSRGEHIAFLGVADCQCEWVDPSYRRQDTLRNLFTQLLTALDAEFGVLGVVDRADLDQLVAELVSAELEAPSGDSTEAIIAKLEQRRCLPTGVTRNVARDYFSRLLKHLHLVPTFTVQGIEAPLYVWQATEGLGQDTQTGNGWHAYAKDCTEHSVDGNHVTLMKPPSVATLAGQLAGYITT